MCVFQLGHGQGLPENPPEDYESQDEFLKSAHHVLMEVCVHACVRACVCCVLVMCERVLFVSSWRWLREIWSVLRLVASFQSLKEYRTCY